MNKVIVLGLNKCSHCDSLVVNLTQQGIPFDFKDADKEGVLADRIEALLKTDQYPIVIIEREQGDVYLHRVDTMEKAKELPVSYATKIGCVNTDSMVAIIKKYIK